jgi:hypothetical protein
MKFTSWRFLDTGYSPAAYNMALDEAMMASIGSLSIAHSMIQYTTTRQACQTLSTGTSRCSQVFFPPVCDSLSRIFL